MEYNIIHNEDCTSGLSRIQDESVDCILTDPPYLYLKNQKLDRPFDEALFFSEAKRVLKKTGFIIIFGRGTSFYRWNCILDNLGFKFKEEIIWNKKFNSSPVLPIQRFHETISIHTINGNINKTKIPYLESKEHNFDCIVGDIKRIASSLNNPKELDNLKQYIKIKKKIVTKKRNDKKIGCTIAPNSTGLYSIPVSVLDQITNGSREKSIIDIVHDRYGRIHPTQKPVRLLERLLALVTKEGDLVVDPFVGSGSTAIACININRKYIGYEIDVEYFRHCQERIKSHTKQLSINF